MRNVVIFASKVKSVVPNHSLIETVDIKGVSVNCGLLNTFEPDFDPKASENRLRVLVQIRAFSCNYRDLSLIFAAIRRGPDNSFFAAGSDFAGEVLDVGADVTSLKPGDRVIANNSYTMSVTGDVQDGVLTNRASKEYQIFPEEKLIKIPECMTDEVAAGFSIGAQTAYSMIRKLALAAGAKVLVMSARSNTSLFAINALRKHRVNVYACTTSMNIERALRDLGVKEVLELDADLKDRDRARLLKDWATSLQGFDYVIDPFFDLHLERVIDCLAPGGKYITCGLHHQYQPLLGIKSTGESADMRRLLLPLLVKNLQILGNCLGLTQDLEQALADYDSSQLRVVIDSAFARGRVAGFFDKTFNARDRFGKVIYSYHSAAA